MGAGGDERRRDIVKMQKAKRKMQSLCIAPR